MSPRRAPAGPRQEAPKTTQERPDASREPFGLASSWGTRGLIFEPSRRPFRASRASR